MESSLAKRIGLMVGGGALLALAPMEALAVSPATLLPHRAVYDLALDSAAERSGIDGLYGRMVYEMNGSPCDGYTVNFRFVTQIQGDDFSRLTDQQTSTHEDLDAGSFRFVTRSYVDQNLDAHTEGEARREDGTIRVSLEEPAEQEFTLEEAKFPTAHMLELIEKAKAGENFYQSHIYDGSDTGRNAMMTTTVIGDPEEPAEDDPELGAGEGLAEESYWPVTMAYFNETEGGDEIPDYQISFKLHENGVTRDLAMDYGEFVLNGQLVELDWLDRQSCD